MENGEWKMYNQKLIQTYDKKGNFEVDAANHSASDHCSTHRAWRNELREHVGKRELQRGSLYFFRQKACQIQRKFVSMQQVKE